MRRVLCCTEDPVIDTVAYEHVRFGDSGLLISVEHASCTLPAPLVLEDDDRPWLQTHWGWDLGAEEVSRRVLRELGGSGHFGRFSRLVCDANRPATASSWIRRRVGGHLLSFNQQLDDAERARRKTALWDRYHEGLDRAMAAMTDPFLLSVHSFTPVLHEEVREMEIGILFDDHADLAFELFEIFADAGLLVALNAPYSGRDGLMYSPWRHGRAHGAPYLELEIRQDLVATHRKAQAFGHRLARLLQGFSPVASRL